MQHRRLSIKAAAAMSMMVLFTTLPLPSEAKKSTAPAAKKADDAGCKSCLSDAAAMFSRNKTRDCVDLLRQWSDRCPNSAQLHLLLSVALTSMGDKVEAEKEAALATLITPNSIAAHMQYAMTAMETGKRTEAIASFTRVTEMDPGDHEAWAALARLHGELHQDEDAKRCAQHAAELEPGTRNAKLSTLLNLKRTGRVAEAKVELQKLLAEKPSALISKDLAKEAMAIGAFEEASTASNIVLQEFPKSTASRTTVAVAKLCTKDYAGSSANSAAWLEAEPKSADALGTSALALCRENKLNDAQEKVTAALNEDPHSCVALLAKGTIEMMQAHYSESETSLHQCLESDESNAKLYGVPQALARLTLSELYIKMGRTADAQDQTKMLATDKRFKELTGK